MAYNAVAHDEHDDGLSDCSEPSPAASRVLPKAQTTGFQPLAIDFDIPGSTSTGALVDGQHEQGEDHAEPRTIGRQVGNKVQSLVAGFADSNYEMVEDDDYTQDAVASKSASPILSYQQATGAEDSLKVRRQRSHSKTDAASIASSMSHVDSIRSDSRHSLPPLITPQQMRSASTRSTKIRHPTPDLQTLQGAYVANVEHLEKTAEKLSMTSSIDVAIRQLHNDQKRADSRRSSLLSSPIEIPLTKQFSNPASIVEVNSAARSGGYSPGGFNMATTSTRMRSGSKGSRFGTRPEPELEGRPLDAFVAQSTTTTSPILSRSASIAEQDEGPSTSAQQFTTSAHNQYQSPKEDLDSSTTRRASLNTIEQAHEMFNDFDGEHYAPSVKQREASIASGPAVTQHEPALPQKRLSSYTSVGRPAMARPLSYMNPSNGQQMVYYPAPVPMMLNLPPKLSKRPVSTIADKGRRQMINSLPPAARQSAVWLPDVIEGELVEGSHTDVASPEEEYLPQHQRQLMGGRRSMADFEHMPPQLRASAFFEQPSIPQVVAVKEESAVATLDSILDASAFAPVNAFTDHAFAGRLGAEVYGPTTNKRSSKTTSVMLDEQEKRKTLTKRRSSSTMLLGPMRRSSSGDLLDADASEKRRSTMSTMFGLHKFAKGNDMDDDDIDGDERAPHSDSHALEIEDESDPEQEGQFDDVYQGPPTTLLAELQLRKQQQKARIRPANATNPGGMHTTLMEREAVAAIESKHRKSRRINLAWEDPNLVAMENKMSDDEDVPLAILYRPKNKKDPNRPMGLMEMRDMEDNEPLSRRRDRLQGRPFAPRANTVGVPSPVAASMVDDGENLAQRAARLETEAGGLIGGLHVVDERSRQSSGDFGDGLIAQFGDEQAKRDSKGKGKEVVRDMSTPVAEEEETLGQRRKRLQAEKEAREREVASAGGAVTVLDEQRPALKTRRSMADILSAHPAAGGVGGGNRSASYGKQVGGLLGIHEQQQAQRASTMIGIGREAALHRGETSGYKEDRRPQVAQNTRHESYGVPAQSQYGMVPSQSYGNLGDYGQQQMMMPHAYTQQSMHAFMQPHMHPYGQQVQQSHPVGGVSQFGMATGGLYQAGGLYGYNNPMAQSMLQLQMQMDQLGSIMAERQQAMAKGQVDMVERWREGVMPQ